MIKQITHLAILAAAALSCSVASAQFTFINPLTDLGIPTGGSGPFSQTFDISNDLGLGSGSVLLNVSNGFTNAGSGSSAFTVSDDEETTFTLSGTTSVFAQVSHGGFLGSPGNNPTGSQSRDGVRGIQSFNLVSSLDGDYQFGSTPNFDAIPGGGNFFVDYVGPDTGNLESNSSSFLFESVAPVTSFTVFSNNTGLLNNNFSVGFAQVPEPSSGILFVIATGMIALRRHRRS